MASDVGERAVELLDKLLAERPEKVGPDFSEATRCITTYRDGMIGQFRAGVVSRTELDGINGVLSVVLAGHFPLGAVPWDKIATAREKLAALVKSGASR